VSAFTNTTNDSGQNPSGKADECNGDVSPTALALVSSYKLESERRMQRSAARTIKNHPAILKNFAAGGSRTRYFAPARTSPSPNIRLDVAITPTRGENTEGRIKPSPNFCPIKTNAGYATPAKMRINMRMSGKSANFLKFGLLKCYFVTSSRPNELLM
jgi:hypothetical protein